MARKSDFEEFIGAIFALVVLILFAGAIIPFGEDLGLNSIFSLLFLVGGIVIGIALLRIIIKLFEDIF